MRGAVNARRAPKKPVKLQINNSGAWKNFISFDADDDLAYSHIADAANTLGNLHHGHIAFRVIIDGPGDVVLTRWTREEGWKKAGHDA